jgi:REP element-mobilizing transposase RayT
MRVAPQQLEFEIRTWGGRRAGAGRKRAGGRRRVPHAHRPPHDSYRPMHVTLRATAGLPSLRRDRLFSRIRGAFAAASHDGFRLLQFSVQSDHVHLLVEADSPTRLTRGLQGLTIRVAKAINAVLRRHGSVWADRYHARALTTPREVRNALVYVLQNWKKHVSGAVGMDPRSSAAWFTGWRFPRRNNAGSAPVASARTWLACVGWLRYGRLDVGDVWGGWCFVGVGGFLSGGLVVVVGPLVPRRSIVRFARRARGDIAVPKRPRGSR